eukprot:462004_1
MKRRASTELPNGCKKAKARFESIVSAAEHGDVKDVKYFLNLDATAVKSTDNFKRNSLHLAAINDNLEVVRYLLTETKINVNSRDKHKKNVLHHAAGKGNLEIVRYLVAETGIGVKSTDNSRKKLTSFGCDERTSRGSSLSRN